MKGRCAWGPPKRPDQGTGRGHPKPVSTNHLIYGYAHSLAIVVPVILRERSLRRRLKRIRDR